MNHLAIGVDVGGSGIKGAAVNVVTGELLTRRHKVRTPAGGTTHEIAEAIREMVAAIRRELSSGPHEATTVGVTLPGVVQGGVMLTAANLDERWIGVNATELFSQVTGADCTVVNDADAAGIAEARHGAIRGLAGTTLVLTFGTGIGSAFMSDGMLVPNFELGHLQFDGHDDIEQHTAASAIAREDISVHEWAGRAERYVAYLERLMHPDRFVLGGGISADASLYLPFRQVSVPVIPAHFRNNAGIVGVACLADDRSR